MTAVYLSLFYLLAVVWLHDVDAEICTSSACEYKLEVRRARTMTYRMGRNTYNVRLNGTRLQVVGNSWHLPENDDFIGTFVNASDVITGDGYERDIITINDQFPGPTLEVMEGAEVVVHVANGLIMEGITVHWHGIDQRHTPFMDGASYITQCPIPPWQNFTYRFKAEPSGTHWYHSHLANQRLDGLFGMLIVHRKLPSLPEFPLMVMDWLHHDAITVEIRNPYGRHRIGSGELIMAAPTRHFSIDNNELSGLHFVGGLVNGRGRADFLKAFPLTEFKVSPDKRYRFRAVHTGVEYTLEISLDGHKLEIVSTDGNDVIPTQVDSLYLMAGETLDFEVTTNQNLGSFWLRSFIIREGSGVNPTPDGLEYGVQAIVRYDGTDHSEEPQSSRRECTASEPCRIYGCPHAIFPASRHKVCLGLTDLHSPFAHEHLAPAFGLDTPDDEIVELFYNFDITIGSSVNARIFLEPRAPLHEPHRERYITECDDQVCDVSGCMCTHIAELPFNKTIQLVIVSYRPGAEFMSPHPVHLHGHNFAVLAMGFAQQNETNGRWIAHNDDVICLGEGLCTRQAWRDGRRPVLNRADPPVKDTVLVPARGYTVIRFVSDNPGFWLFHCHMEHHMIEGMIMVLNEAPGRHPSPPTGFPTCPDYEFTSEEFHRYMEGDYPVLDEDGGIPVPSPDPTQETDEENPSNDDLLEHIKEYCQPTDGVISLSYEIAIGLVFGLVSVGGLLAMVPIVIFTCRGRHKDK